MKRVIRKAVHRILKLMGWSMKKRPKGLRPRVAGWKSATNKPNQRWAIDTSHFMAQRDGLCHITAIIDCCDRKIVSWRVPKSGKADIAAAALEDAYIRWNPLPGLKLRSDNGLVFGSKKFHKVVRRHTRLQEFITPYAPVQKVMIEFRTFKSERLWLKQFKGLREARESIDSFVETYHEDRPHGSLGMLTPSEWSERFAA